MVLTLLCAKLIFKIFKESVPTSEIHTVLPSKRPIYQGSVRSVVRILTNP
jgi:hypothetical protein